MSASEALGVQGGQRAALEAGNEQISAEQEITFRRYSKYVLQQDGFVFWVGTGDELVVKGSLHYATDREQAEDETVGSNLVTFTSEQEVSRFNDLDPQSMWIGSWPIAGGAPLRVAFSRRSNFYKESDLWHYDGIAVYPALDTQIIDDPTQLPDGPIVSNSLPIWLSLGTFGGITVPVYPSFLVPDNVKPPYIVAHIDPNLTESLGAAPVIGAWPGQTVPNSGTSPLHKLSVSMLARDVVVLTLYGFSNQLAWQYLAYLYDSSVDGTAPFGFANSPVPVDPKRPQAEIAAIAQKKQITVHANYDQGAADAVARRLLLSAMVSSLTFEGGFALLGQVETAQDEQTVAAEGSVFE